MGKTIISAALTGSFTPKSLNPNIPTTPEEIADDAVACWEKGAAIVHLHMRDENGYGTMDKELFRKTVDLIKNRCDAVINLTTSGGIATDEERIEHLIELKPEMASFDAGTFNWMPGGVFDNTPQFLEKLGKVMTEYKIKPEVEVFYSGMLYNGEYYVQQGIIPGPLHVQFVLGVGGAEKATVQDLVYLYNKLPKDATWSALGVGKGHLPILLATLALGGHVRVGLEDNVYYSKGKLATNPQLVERAARLIKEADSEVATPDDAREILGLRGR